MKRNQIFSLIVSVAIVALLMYSCYSSWSRYGYYGTLSFIYSAVFTIPWGIFVYVVINYLYSKFKKED